MMTRRLAFLLTAAACTVASAQRADFGVQLGLTTPGGDMTNRVDSDAAISLGGQVRVKIANGHAVVGRFDFVQFSGHDNTWDPPAQVKDKVFSLGVAYNYYFSHQVGQGFYLGGGFGYIQKDETYTAPAGYAFDPGADPSKTNDRLYLDFGLGYAFTRHISAFGRFQFFPDERQGDTWNSSTHEYESTYSTSTLATIGVEFHF
jgi:long-subunit fatty acid transport protein